MNGNDGARHVKNQKTRFASGSTRRAFEARRAFYAVNFPGIATPKSKVVSSNRLLVSRSRASPRLTILGKKKKKQKRSDKKKPKKKGPKKKRGDWWADGGVHRPGIPCLGLSTAAPRRSGTHTHRRLFFQIATGHQERGRGTVTGNAIVGNGRGGERNGKPVSVCGLGCFCFFGFMQGDRTLGLSGRSHPRALTRMRLCGWWRCDCEGLICLRPNPKRALQRADFGIGVGDRFVLVKKEDL